MMTEIWRKIHQILTITVGTEELEIEAVLRGKILRMRLAITRGQEPCHRISTVSTIDTPHDAKKRDRLFEWSGTILKFANLTFTGHKMVDAAISVLECVLQKLEDQGVAMDDAMDDGVVLPIDAPDDPGKTAASDSSPGYDRSGESHLKTAAGAPPQLLEIAPLIEQCHSNVDVQSLEVMKKQTHDGILDLLQPWCEPVFTDNLKAVQLHPNAAAAVAICGRWSKDFEPETFDVYTDGSEKHGVASFAIAVTSGSRVSTGCQTVLLGTFGGIVATDKSDLNYLGAEEHTSLNAELSAIGLAALWIMAHRSQLQGATIHVRFNATAVGWLLPEDGSSVIPIFPIRYGDFSSLQKLCLAVIG